jgi:hypothetical protein
MDVDFPDVLEEVAPCYDCECDELADGQPTMHLKRSEGGLRYSIDVCGFCEINGERVAGVCEYSSNIDMVVGIAAASIVAIIVLAAIIALIVVLVTAKKTYDLIMAARGAMTHNLQDSMIHVPMENSGVNPAAG